MLKNFAPKHFFFRSMSNSTHAEQLVSNYNSILANVKRLNPKARLVAVSKYKPASDIQTLYDAGVRDFGENYVQELIAKAKELPKDIQWHFIGSLQSGKCNILSREIPNLYAVQTIDSLKKAKKLDTSRRAIEGSAKINVYLQVNTSGEEQKSGYDYQNLEEIVESVNYLLKEATHLNLQGLMTIGSITESKSDQENADFKRLVDLKSKLDSQFNTDLQLSMGMSNDYKTALEQGSSCVRVGSSIFGTRVSKEEAKSQ